MANLDALLAGSGLAFCVLLALLVWRDGASSTQGRVLGALAVSVTAQLLASSPLAVLLPDAAGFVARLLGVPNVGLLWWFCLVLVRDDFRVDAESWAGMLALSLVPGVYVLADLGVIASGLDTVAAIGSVPPLVMVGHVVLVAVRERATGVIEPRRRARLGLAAALLGALVLSLATEELTNAQLASILRSALVVVPMSAVLLLWLIRIDADRLRFAAAAGVAEHEPRIALRMDPHDIALHRRLMKALEGDACYLQPGLTIEMLADRLRAPVQQVRTLINGGLGHRNFPAFVNEYRVAHAKRLLADPERARDTVLSVAMQSGFASLATFNRVFREVEGSTPTEFRSQSLAQQALEVGALRRDS